MIEPQNGGFNEGLISTYGVLKLLKTQLINIVISCLISTYGVLKLRIIYTNRIQSIRLISTYGVLKFCVFRDLLCARFRFNINIWCFEISF